MHVVKGVVVGEAEKDAEEEDDYESAGARGLITAESPIDRAASRSRSTACTRWCERHTSLTIP